MVPRNQETTGRREMRLAPTPRFLQNSKTLKTGIPVLQKLDTLRAARAVACEHATAAI
jgi:hypothetical protein